MAREVEIRKVGHNFTSVEFKKLLETIKVGRSSLEWIDNEIKDAKTGYSAYWNEREPDSSDDSDYAYNYTTIVLEDGFGELQNVLLSEFAKVDSTLSAVEYNEEAFELLPITDYISAEYTWEVLDKLSEKFSKK